MADSSSPGYHYTWLQNITGPVEHALEGPVEAEQGYYDALKESLGVDAHVDIHSEVVQMAHGYLVCLLLVGLALIARKGINAARAQGGNLQFVPDRTLTVRNFFELTIGGFYDLVVSVLGPEHARRHFMLVGGLFFYILFSNVMGLVPGFTSPTGSFQMNLAMSLIVLVYFVVAGVQANGSHFFTHLFGPVLALAPLIGLVEIISTFVARPFSLTLRLTGNMFGDHMVFGIMSDLVPVLWPCIFLALGLFVSVIQALVFSLLSTVYIALSVAPMHDHDDDH